MRTVWKFPLLLIDEEQPIKAPGPWRVVHVADQAGQPTVWIEVPVDLNAEQHARSFYVVGTGHTVYGADWLHVGTAHSGPFVWHVYMSVDA